MAQSGCPPLVIVGACITRVAEALRSAGLHVLHERGPWPCMEAMAELHLGGVSGAEGQSQRHMRVARTANEQGEVEIITATWQPWTGAAQLLSE